MVRAKGLPVSASTINDLLSQTEGGEVVMEYLDEVMKETYAKDLDGEYLAMVALEKFNKSVLVKARAFLDEATTSDQYTSDEIIAHLNDEILSTMGSITRSEDTHAAVDRTYQMISDLQNGIVVPYWETGSKKFDQIVAIGPHKIIMVAAAKKIGKCFAPGTKIIMSDGSLMNIEDIKNGMRVMTPEGKHALVSGVTSGTDDMYLVKQSKGVDYTVNSAHILSLKKVSHKNARNTDPGRVLNIPITDWLDRPKHWRSKYKGWKGFSTYGPEKELPIDPYMFGLWLGDGSSACPEITTEDREVVDYLKSNYTVTTHGTSTNRYYMKGIKQSFIDLGVLNNKHIPEQYMKSSIQQRLELLAGLVDSDGYLMKSKTNNEPSGYEITQKRIGLSIDIHNLCESLGFHVTKEAKIATCEYKGELIKVPVQRMMIRGAIESVPCRVERKIASKRETVYNPTLSNVSVEYAGVGTYHGFEVEGSLFMLEDHTVVHNTRFVIDRVMRLLQVNTGINVVWFTFEMRPEEVIMNQIAWQTGIDTRMLQGKMGAMDKETLELISQTKTWIKTLPIRYISQRRTIDQIEKDLQKWGKGPTLVIIDNLGLIEIPHGMTDIQSDDLIAKRMVNMRDSMDLCIMPIHHLSKESESKYSKEELYKPKATHVRGSSRLVDYANELLLLHRPGHYKDLKDRFSPQEWEKIQDKFEVDVPINRDGPEGEIVFRHSLATSTFDEL